MKPSMVSIIILCHNDRVYLRRCVASIRRYTKRPYEIIFVDNASEDGAIHELRRIKRTFPHPVRIIRNKVNRYFAGGNNQGIRAARGEYILLLNADTVVTPGWLDGLLRCAQRGPDIGLVAPYTNQAVGLQVLWPPAYRSLALLPRWARSWSRKRRGRTRAVPYLIGFCLLIPRKVIRKVGLLDERFGPGGHEDYDYCLRVRFAGFRLVIAEDVYVHHVGGRGYLNMQYQKLKSRNLEIFYSKWCSWAWDRFDEGLRLHGRLPRVIVSRAGNEAANGYQKSLRGRASISRASRYLAAAA